MCVSVFNQQQKKIFSVSICMIPGDLNRNYNEIFFFVFATIILFYLDARVLNFLVPSGVRTNAPF